ncbi:MAG: ankyrin repeat domain-containing protein [Candidatus Rokubacteria bacterium]|nr:ankyrin repeat domain-containing protein [Candidatus Rokubacteria bacterium]
MTALRPHVAGRLDLFEACVVGDLDAVRRAFDGDPSLANAVASDGFGPLGLASFFDHEPVVRLLLEHGARVDAASANAMRIVPLHSAAAARAVPITRLLLEHGAPVDATQGDGKFTPLMEAATNGQAEMIDLLLTHGADVRVCDAHGPSAADHARASGHASLAEYLSRC